MLKKIISLFGKYHIDLCGCLPLSRCRVTRQYLLDKAGIANGSVVIFAIPYYTKACDGDCNLSAYAVPRDYHLFIRDMAQELQERLQNAFPSNRFAFFADHSPIDERDAAVRTGLGVMGKNGLLITEPYSSYVFLGELITDAVLPYREYPPATCSSCGACISVCPWQKGESEVCLSALSQKKGELSEDEQSILSRYGSVWGCDICQEICPHTKRSKAADTIYTPIPFFQTDCLPHITSEIITAMEEKDLACRAYFWRGRETLLRNLAIAEESDDAKRGDQSSQKATE